MTNEWQEGEPPHGTNILFEVYAGPHTDGGQPPIVVESFKNDKGYNYWNKAGPNKDQGGHTFPIYPSKWRYFVDENNTVYLH